mmetsp:Transcript_33203/g.109774  ORF Transcript_33203/g.109774 Transcript_33203/m.109774 type:complete len:254 (-) Transcript_33203:192-953(-)
MPRQPGRLRLVGRQPPVPPQVLRRGRQRPRPPLAPARRRGKRVCLFVGARHGQGGVHAAPLRRRRRARAGHLLRPPVRRRAVRDARALRHGRLVGLFHVRLPLATPHALVQRGEPRHGGGGGGRARGRARGRTRAFAGKGVPRDRRAVGPQPQPVLRVPQPAALGGRPVRRGHARAPPRLRQPRPPPGRRLALPHLYPAPARSRARVGPEAGGEGQGPQGALRVHALCRGRPGLTYRDPQIAAAETALFGGSD